MLIGKHAWQRFKFARKTDPTIIFQKNLEDIKDVDLVLNWDREVEHDPHFCEFAQIPANTFRVDKDVMERAKQFYLERGVRTGQTPGD